MLFLCVLWLFVGDGFPKIYTYTILFKDQLDLTNMVQQQMMQAKYFVMSNLLLSITPEKMLFTKHIRCCLPNTNTNYWDEIINVNVWRK